MTSLSVKVTPFSVKDMALCVRCVHELTSKDFVVPGGAQEDVRKGERASECATHLDRGSHTFIAMDAEVYSTVALAGLFFSNAVDRTAHESVRQRVVPVSKSGIPITGIRKFPLVWRRLFAPLKPDWS